MSIMVNMFAKEKINNEKLVKQLEVNKNNILFLKEISDLADKKDQAVAVEYRGQLDKEDTDEYVGYHYYIAYIYNDGFAEKFKKLNRKDFVVEVLQ